MGARWVGGVLYLFLSSFLGTSDSRACRFLLSEGVIRMMGGQVSPGGERQRGSVAK